MVKQKYVKKTAASLGLAVKPFQIVFSNRRRGFNVHKLLCITLIAVLLTGTPVLNANAKQDGTTIQDAQTDVTYVSEEDALARLASETDADYGSEAQAVKADARDWSAFSSDYCLDKLSTAAEKAFYKALCEECDVYLNSAVSLSEAFGGIYTSAVSFDGVSDDRAVDIARVFIIENPQYYFLNGEVSISSGNKRVWLRVYDDFADGEKRMGDTTLLYEKLDAWTAEIAGKQGDYAKEKTIHDIVASNVINSTGSYENSVYAAVVFGKAQATGFAKLFGLLSNASGLDCVQVSSQDAVWNKVKIYGTYYNVDTCWDMLTGTMKYDYFNVPDSKFAWGHEPLSMYKGLLPETTTKCPETISKPAVTADGIYIAGSDNNGILAGLKTTKAVESISLEYSWWAYDSMGNCFMVQDWVKNNEWLSWKPEANGEYTLVAKTRVVGDTATETQAIAGAAYHEFIKGICQMPNAGGGYLIGIESYKNEGYTYEMQILDCSLYAAGKDAWTYTTGKCAVDGTCLWTTWKPQYGYYWTLFRIYDKNDNIIDEVCYGFANVF